MEQNKSGQVSCRLEVGSQKWLDEIFSYHAPTPEQIEHYSKIRAKAKELALVIVECTPRCADQSAALRALRETVMTANAAVALGGLV